MSPEKIPPDLIEDEQRRASRIKYFEQRRESIMQQYLWTPISVHTSTTFWSWVRENISKGEMPPFYGILNPSDDEGNLVLKPWVRSYDRGLYVKSFFTKAEPEVPLIGMTEMEHLYQGVDEFMDGIADPNFGIKLLARCTRGLKIPWTELVIIGRAVEFLPNRGRDQS